MHAHIQASSHSIHSGIQPQYIQASSHSTFRHPANMQRRHSAMQAHICLANHVASCL